MKKIILILFILMVAPVCADVVIKDIEAELNDDRVSGVDEDGGDIDCYIKDEIKIIITLENEFENETEAKIVGRIRDIDDGADIEKERDWFDIDGDDRKDKWLSWGIPSDADTGRSYDLEIDISWKNLTNHVFEEDTIYFDVYVKEGEPEESESDVKDSIVLIAHALDEAVGNMTIAYQELQGDIGECFGAASFSANLSNSLSTCREERGICQSRLEEKQSDYEELDNAYVNYKEEIGGLEETHDLEIEKKNNEIQSLKNEVGRMYTLAQCENRTQTRLAEKEDEQKKSQNNTTMLVLGGAGIVGLIWWQKKKKRDVASGTPDWGGR